MVKPFLHSIPPKPPVTRDGNDLAREIELLLGQMPPSERQRLVRRLAQVQSPSATPRAGGTLGVIALAIENNPNREWTAQDFKEIVADQGIDAKPKEVYNAAAYLIRRGQLKQVGYGRYVVHDFSGNVVTSEFDEDPLRSHDE